MIIFVAAMLNGSLAEWLGAGLQNRRRRFESARNLFCIDSFLPLISLCGRCSSMNVLNTRI